MASHSLSQQAQVDLTNLAQRIRHRVLQLTLKNQGGYLSQACSSAELFAAWYGHVLHLEPSRQPRMPQPFQQVPGPLQPTYPNGSVFNGSHAPRWDRFFLSPSQYSVVLYAVLVETGRLAPQALDQFNQDGSTVEMIGAEHSPGIEVMSGSLGQGLSQAAGTAWARQRKGEMGKTWVFMSDGEFQIGQTWEALQTVSHYRLNHLGIIVDVNGQQCDGTVASVMTIEPLQDRLTAFGLRVLRVNGHDIEALVSAAQPGPQQEPLIILADTHPWQGLEILRERAPKYHYVRFTSKAEQARYAQALANMQST